MAGKGGKGLVAAKTMAGNKDKDKDKKKPMSRSARAGIQVLPSNPSFFGMLKFHSVSLLTVTGKIDAVSPWKLIIIIHQYELRSSVQDLCVCFWYVEARN